MNLQSKLAMAALFFGTAAGAQAQIVPTLTSVTPQGGGEYLYDYTVNLDGGTTVNYNDYFTIYDIYGYTSTSSMPTSWTASVQNIGVTPAGAAPPDSATTPNITYTYTGGPSINGGAINSEYDLGDFEFLSTQGNFTAPTQGFYSYDAIETDNQADQSGVSTVSTPAAPEPGSLGLALAGAMMSLWRRK